jgi:hypothetical protein
MTAVLERNNRMDCGQAAKTTQPNWMRMVSWDERRECGVLISSAVSVASWVTLVDGG